MDLNAVQLPEKGLGRNGEKPWQIPSCLCSLSLCGPKGRWEDFVWLLLAPLHLPPDPLPAHPAQKTASFLSSLPPFAGTSDKFSDAIIQKGKFLIA